MTHSPSKPRAVDFTLLPDVPSAKVAIAMGAIGNPISVRVSGSACKAARRHAVKKSAATL